MPSDNGKVNPLMVAAVPPIIFLAGLMVYNIYRAVVPPAFTVDNEQTGQVEAMDVIGQISPIRSNGLPIPQASSLRAGGSSRLVITHKANNGAFLLVSGTISSGFLIDKVPLDNMLHLKFPSTNVRVQSGGETVKSFLFYSRKETAPLRTADPNTNPDVSVLSLLFTTPVIKPVPPGIIYPGKYVSDNGMTIECLGGGFSSGLEFSLDDDSLAWIETPRNIAIQHTAIGTDDLPIGILIPLDDGTDPYSIIMFGEEVASVDRPTL